MNNKTSDFAFWGTHFKLDWVEKKVFTAQLD